MANYFISLLAPTLQTHGHLFLATRQQQRLRDRTSSLQQTARLLLQPIRDPQLFREYSLDLAEAGISSQTTTTTITDSNTHLTLDQLATQVEVTNGFIARSFLSLLQSPVRLDTDNNNINPNQLAGRSLLPETLIWDGKRLAIIRDLVVVNITTNRLFFI